MHSEFPHDSGDAIPDDLARLTELLAGIDAPEILQAEECLRRLAESFARRRRILNLVQEALSQLRLDVKYLMFDLEMTRRERDALQERLKELDL